MTETAEDIKRNEAIPKTEIAQQETAKLPEIEEISPLEEAKKILEFNRKLLLEMQEERKKLEKTAANIMLGGRAFAEKQAEKKEETPQEYSARILRGGK